MSKKKTSAKKPRFKVQRRLGVELPGLGKPGALERRPYPPGQHGNQRRKYSDYALRLEEKQKVRCHYGLKERQLRRFIRDSKRGQSSNWISKLAGLLERRLDNVVFRLGFAPSIKAARQMISHGHVLVDGKKVSIGSYVVQVGSQVKLKDSAKQHQSYLRAKEANQMELPDYMQKNEEKDMEVGVIQSIPNLEHIPFPFNAGLFTEYYAAHKV